jgi:hypothetical protein
MDDRNDPELMIVDDDVQTVQSKWLNDDGKHVMKNSHEGIYSPKGLVIELNKKPGAVFLQYFVAKIVTEKGHAGFGACGLHCKTPGCCSILKPNNINQSVSQHGKKCQPKKKRVATQDVIDSQDSPALHTRSASKIPKLNASSVRTRSHSLSWTSNNARRSSVRS